VEPDVEQLAAAVAAVLRDPARARLLGAAGFERYRSTFTAAAMADRVHDALERASAPALSRAGTLRLFVVAPWGEGLGGAESNLRTFLEHVDRRRVEPTIVFLQSGPFAGEVEGLGFRTVVLPAGRLRQVAHAARAVAALSRLLRRERPDLILDWAPKAHLYAGIAAHLAGMDGRIVWWQRGITRGHWMDRVATALPALAVVCSSEAAAAAQRRLRPHRRTIVLYPGVTIPPPGKPDGAFRAAHGLPVDEPVVGIVGRLQPSKGQHVLLAALADLRRRGLLVHGVVVGDDAFELSPGYLERLHRIAADSGIERHVTFAGHVADPGPWLDTMDVVVNASETESFGLSIAEAMGRGRAVVAFRSGGPEEIVEHEVSGILIEHSERELADAIERLLADPDLREQLGARARERIVGRFSAPAAVDRLEAALMQLVRESGSELGDDAA